MVSSVPLGLLSKCVAEGGGPSGTPVSHHLPFASVLVADDPQWAESSTAVSDEGGPGPLRGSGIGSGHTEGAHFA